jgi:endoglucanase
VNGPHLICLGSGGSGRDNNPRPWQFALCKAPRVGRLNLPRLGALVLVAAGGALSIAAFSPSTTTGQHAELAIRVSGNQLVDARGQAVRLVGVNRSGSEFKCIQGGTDASRGTGIFDGPTDARSVAAIAAWHVTTVRVPLNEDCWLGINGVASAWGGVQYQTSIKQYVETLHAGGLRVIVDLHWSAPGSHPAMGQQPMPDSDHALAFWTSVAGAFRDDEAMIFDAFNEPFPLASNMQDPSLNPWRCWLLGCAMSKYTVEGQEMQSASWHAAGMQEIVNAIRSTGSRQPILASGVGYGNDLTGWLLYKVTDPAGQLMASWHSYPQQGCAKISCWEEYVRPVAAKFPVVIGETGDSVCSSASFIGPMLNWADQAGLGYLGWTWNTWGNCDDVLVRSYDGTPTPNYGTVFHDHLMAQPETTSAPPSRTNASEGDVSLLANLEQRLSRVRGRFLILGAVAFLAIAALCWFILAVRHRPRARG